MPPDPKAWRVAFPLMRMQPKDKERVTLSNPKTAQLVVDSYLGEKSRTPRKDMVIIESYPGKFVWFSFFIP